MNDTHLRAAFPVPHEPASLDAKIDRALVHHSRVLRTKRQVVLGFAATAAATFAFVALPAVQAQASLSGIVRALDKQTRARITTYSIDEMGHRWVSATTTIANGDVVYQDARGTRQDYEIGDKSYSLDPTINRFIVRPRRPGGSIRLSDMLSGASGFSLGKRADVRKVDGVLRATIENNGLPERYVIDADPQTELPVRMHIDAKERGVWRTRQELAFDYNADVATLQPDLKRYPATTEKEAEAAFNATMTRQTLAVVSFKKERLIVRAFEVAADGTVFVAFQTGDRRAHSWRGYSLSLRDDRGIHYVRYGQIFTDQDGPFGKDGKLEVEMFVPARPVAPNQPRTLAFTTQAGANGKLARGIDAIITHADGTVWKGIQIDGVPHDGPQPTPIRVLRKTQVLPTCDTHPAWLSRLDFMGFGNPIAAEMSKATVRAHVAMDEKDWTEAERWLDEDLRLKREHDRQGYGPWDLSRTMDDLDKVHEAMGARKAH